jgi:DNA-binding NarL/FixJ family response regulator
MARDEGSALRNLVTTLTPRETQVLDGVARGLGNHQIAKEIGVSEKTVRNNVSRVLAKLDVNTRARAIVLAREAGFGKGDDSGHGSRL